MSNSSSTQSGGIGILGLLGVLFIGLKLAGIITWSWWYVTLPFWGGLALFLGVLVVVFIGALIVALVNR